MRSFAWHAGAAALLAATLILSGCSAVGGLVERGLEEAAGRAGQEIDINLAGENCLPDWVNAPAGDLIHAQGFAGGGDSSVEVCVVSLMTKPPVDVSQSLPQVADGADLSQMAVLLGLLAVQAGWSQDEIQEIFRSDDIGARLQELENKGILMGLYGDGSRLLLVVTSDINAPEVQVSLGVMCEGNC